MNILMVGSSSAAAQSLIVRLKKANHTVIEIARNEGNGTFQMGSYVKDDFPAIDQPIDGLVYFPGTITLKPFHQITDEEFLNDFSINTLGAARAIRTYLPNLKKSEHASVVLISSVAAQLGMPYHTSIAAAKAALEGFGRSLAAEFSPKIRVNCIAPSLFKSPLADRWLNTPEKEEQIKKRNPMQKIGNAEDIAAMISFLLSEEAAWITGQTMAVDGGMGKLKL